MKENIHVIYQDDEWKVKKENSEKASEIFSTKEEAVEYAKKEAEKDEVELIIHNKDNTISEKNSYGNDNYPPKG